MPASEPKITESSCSPYARSYGRFVKTLGLLNKLLPLRLRIDCAEMVGKILNPDKLLNQKITDNLARFIGESNKPIWSNGKILRSFHAHAGVAGLDHITYQRKTSRWLDLAVHVNGIENLKIEDPTKSSGTLVLTYHNHYKFLLPVTLGLLGFKVSAMAIDWRLSEVGLCGHTRSIYKNFFSDVESYFNGGRFIYLDGTSPISTLRSLNKTLQDRQILISLNDVYHPISGSRHHEVQFFKRTLRCPTGIIEKAIHSGAEVVCAYIYWDRHRANYRLNVKRFDNTSDAKHVVDSYVELLETEIKRDPGFWEGWKLL